MSRHLYKDVADGIIKVAYGIRVMLAHCREKMADWLGLKKQAISSKHPESLVNSVYSQITAMDMGSPTPNSKKKAMNPFPIIKAMWEADDEGDDEDDDDDIMVVDVTMTPVLQCIMRLSDGSTHEADKYMPGENGCAIAIWTKFIYIPKFRPAHQTNVVNDWIHENRLLKPNLKRKAADDEEDDVDESAAAEPHKIGDGDAETGDDGGDAEKSEQDKDKGKGGKGKGKGKKGKPKCKAKADAKAKPKGKAKAEPKAEAKAPAGSHAPNIKAALDELP